MPIKSIHNFHVPLPTEVFQQLKQEAKRTHTTATEIMRLAVTVWLKHKQRQALHDSIVEYAKKMAGTKMDLDEDLEAASLELWADEDSSS